MYVSCPFVLHVIFMRCFIIFLLCTEHCCKVQGTYSHDLEKCRLNKVVNETSLFLRFDCKPFQQSTEKTGTPHSLRNYHHVFITTIRERRPWLHKITKTLWCKWIRYSWAIHLYYYYFYYYHDDSQPLTGFHGILPYNLYVWIGEAERSNDG